MSSKNYTDEVGEGILLTGERGGGYKIQKFWVYILYGYLKTHNLRPRPHKVFDA